MVTRGRPKADDPVYVSGTVLARWLGVSVASLPNFEARGMPREPRKRYKIADCIQWYIHDKLGSNSRDIQEARKKLYDAQERKAQLEIAQIRGQLVDAEEVVQSHMLMATLFSSQLRSLGQRVAGLLQGKTALEIRTTIDDECRSILEATSLAVSLDPSEDGGGGNTAPAAKTNGGRMGRRAPRTPPRKPRTGPVAKH